MVGNRRRKGEARDCLLRPEDEEAALTITTNARGANVGHLPQSGI